MPLLSILRDETQTTAHRAHEAHLEAIREAQRTQAAAAEGATPLLRLREQVRGAAARGSSRGRHHGLHTFARGHRVGGGRRDDDGL